jgi:hypothetical protein
MRIFKQSTMNLQLEGRLSDSFIPREGLKAGRPWRRGLQDRSRQPTIPQPEEKERSQ